MSTISNMLSLGSDIKSAVVNPEGIKDPKKLSKGCDVAKIAIVAMAIVTFVASVFSGPLGLIVGGAVLVGLYDTHRMVGNIKKIAEDKNTGKSFKNYNPVQAKAALGRGTIVAKFMLGLMLKKAMA